MYMDYIEKFFTDSEIKRIPHIGEKVRTTQYIGVVAWIKREIDILQGRGWLIGIKLCNNTKGVCYER